MSETYPDNAVRLFGFSGDALYMLCTVKDSTGAAVDLTGATIDFELGSLVESTSGVTVTNGNAAGTITIVATDAAMAAIVAGTYDISVRYTLSGNSTTLFTGTYTARASVIRW